MAERFPLAGNISKFLERKTKKGNIDAINLTATVARNLAWAVERAKALEINLNSKDQVATPLVAQSLLGAHHLSDCQFVSSRLTYEGLCTLALGGSTWIVGALVWLAPWCCTALPP